MERFATELEYQNSSKDEVSYVVESDTVHYPAANSDPYPWKIIWSSAIPPGGFDENRVPWEGGTIGTDEKLIQYPLDFFDDKPSFFTAYYGIMLGLREIVIPKLPTNGYQYFLSGANNLRRIELGEGWKNSTLTSNLLLGAGSGSQGFSSRLDVIFPKEIGESYFSGLVSSCVYPEICNTLTIPKYRSPGDAFVTIPERVSNIICSSDACKELILTGPASSLTLNFAYVNGYLSRLILKKGVTTINCTSQNYSNITEIIIKTTTMPTTSPIIAKTIGETGKGRLVIPSSKISDYRNRIINNSPYLIDPNDLSNWEIIGI